MYVSNNVYMYKCTLVQCKKQEETKLGLRNLMMLPLVGNTRSFLRVNSHYPN